ncbi:C-terminal processing protease CtpA/Prc [Dokdonia sp. Hel_I_53]|nr:C-terminal processing protease CtpA/Prc [Dokdonia sp. Hel_I_53]
MLLAICGLLIFSSCDDDLDDIIRPASTLEISDFIYRGLNIWSLYKADVPELANDFFDTENERLEYLAQFESPEATFDALISPRDRFSVLRSDYIELENALSGIRTSNGMNFSLFIDPTDDTKAFGAVRYVVNDSPADQAGVERGMLFTMVDGFALQDPSGSAITSDTSFIEFFSPETYSISLATFDDTNGFTLTGEEIVLNKTELTINPVHTTKVLNVDGESVGYLHYTSFTNEFDPALNEAFAQFQNAGVTDLILDLRYNGGGSVETANDLSTMITGQFEGQEFITQQYNADRNPDNETIRYFNNNLGSSASGASINSLGLNKVYILTTNRTASASELIISGLNPYIEVIQIGTNTTGKFEGSFLLYDAPDFRRANANPNHRYVMLPLTFKSVNANGLTDYFDGFTPEIEIVENFRTYGTLGEPGEPLLDAAINAILNGRSLSKIYNGEHTPTLFDNEQTEALYQRMITEPSIE